MCEFTNSRIKGLDKHSNVIVKLVFMFLFVYICLRFFELELLRHINCYQNRYNEYTNFSARNHVYIEHYRSIKNHYGINCLKILDNDIAEIKKSKKRMKNPTYTRGLLTSNFYLKITKECSTFRRERGYINHPLSDEESRFPLAFSILTYKDIELTERLLRLIYRPHNFYCIHVDRKMSKPDQNALGNIARCLSNVFIAKESIDVKWGGLSLLEAELSCMRTLWPYKGWKYYLNLAGQEFPLKTNRQIIAILNQLDGANVVDGSAYRARTTYAYRFATAKTPPPHKIQLVKGSMHIAANRYFVDFCLHDRRSLDFYLWLNKTIVPDETYFSSLNHNPHLKINGSFIGDAEEYELKPFFLRYTVWQDQKYRRCKGKFVREVCILGVEDLPRIYNGIALFANKFYLNFEPLALDCLEEVLYEQTWDEYINDKPVDTNFYSSLDYAKLQLKL